MADTTERPTNVTAAPTAADLPPADSPRDEPYRPLSLLAVFGFNLAALYAFLVLLGGLVPIAARNPRLFPLLLLAGPLLAAQVVLLGKRRGGGRLAASAGLGLVAVLAVLGIGGLMAFSGSSPWLLLDGAGWLLVAAAVVVCWLARTSIANSEGTLGGADLARWGLTLGLVSGLLYGVYLASNTFAVRGQARQAAEEFLALISKGDEDSLHKAFQLTLPVRARLPEDGNLRQGIEIGYNLSQDPMGRTGGPYSQFRQSQYVQLMVMGTSEIKFDRAAETTFDRGAYTVGLFYRVDGPVGPFLVLVQTTGEEFTDGAGTSRRWRVVGTGTRLSVYSPNEQGNKFRDGAGFASGSASRWVKAIEAGNANAAYLETLTEADRAKQAAFLLPKGGQIEGIVGVGLPAAVAANKAGRKAFEDAVARYRDGELIDTKTHDFFVAPDQTPANKTVHKDRILAELKRLYRGEGPADANLYLANQQLPGFDIKAGNIYLMPVRIVIPSRGKGDPGYLVEADLELVGPPPEKPASGGYRVGKLRLIRGQFQPQAQKG